MGRILFVSYGHTILKVASSIQNQRLGKALQDYYSVDVLQRTNQRTIAPFAICSFDFTLLDRILYKLFPFLISVISIDRNHWTKKAFHALKKSLDSYEYVIIPYEPYTTRRLQYLIKKHSNVKVVTILYDPYVDNIFFSQSKIGLVLRGRIEKIIVSSSDCVVVNSPRMYRTFLKRYPGTNIQWLPFCGKEEVIKNDTNNNEKFTIVHAGNIFGKRKIDSLNNTITIIKHQYSKLSEKLNILLYGSICQGYDKVQKVGNDDVIINKGSVSQEEIERVLANADALLLIDPMDEANFSYPSKLCEYFQYGKLILGFSGKGTPSYEALKETNNIVHAKGEESAMAADIIELIEKGAKNRTPQYYSEQFYPQNVAKELKSIIDNM